MGKPKAAPRAKLVEEEQFLFLGTSFELNSKNGACGKRTFPIFLWSRLAASARKALYSVSCFLSGNEMP